MSEIDGIYQPKTAKKSVRKPRKIEDNPSSSVALRRFEATSLQHALWVVYHHTVLAQTIMPYRDPGDGVRDWEHRNGFAMLSMGARRVLDPLAEKWVTPGLPFGAKPRLIMSHLTTALLASPTPEIATERTVTKFLAKVMSMDQNGRNIRTVRDQMMRLAACDITVGVITAPGKAVQRHTRLSDGYEVWAKRETDESGNEIRVLWPTVIRFSERFFESVKEHSVPLNERHLIGLSNSALALDIYVWLAQRLRRVNEGVPTSITWASLMEQFGQNYARERKFRETFLDALKCVLVLYRDAKVELTGCGLKLFYSKPPVPENQMVTVLKKL